MQKTKNRINKFFTKAKMIKVNINRAQFVMEKVRKSEQLGQLAKHIKKIKLRFNLFVFAGFVYLKLSKILTRFLLKNNKKRCYLKMCKATQLKIIMFKIILYCTSLIINKIKNDKKTLLCN